MIADVRLGALQAVRMYRGDDVVWEKNAPLPEGYTAVKALQNTYRNSGFHRIVTDIPWSKIGRIEGDIEVISARQNPAWNTREMLYQSNGNSAPFFWVDMVTGHGIDGNGLSVLNAAYDGKKLDVALKVTGDGSKIFMFAGWSDNLWSGIYNYGQHKIYDSDGLLIANCIPCIQTVTGIPGMFNTVSNAFWRNSGSRNYTIIT